MKLPARGLERSSLMSRLDAYRDGDMRWRSGRTFAYVYEAGAEAEAVARDAFMAFLGENALDPTVFPSLLRLETELVAICAEHLGGGPDAAGSFTSGGTESIILAVKSARDHARATRPEITRPQILLPTTAHASFHKAAHYLGLERVLVPVDPATWRANPAAMAAAITDDTILMVGSAPSYGHCVIDPIEALGQLALERGLLFHVDACVGGWLLPYYRRLGEDVPAFDLSVPGVSSISMDLHKYALAPKGASVVLYNDKALRRAQIFACSEWTGYTVINPTVQSTKSGGPLAAAWATLHFLGDEGYLSRARDLLEATRRLVAGIEATPGLRLLARPELCMAAAASDEVSVFHVIDEMKVRGWYVQPQLGYDGSPANIHFSLNPGNTAMVEPMLEDLKAAVEAARKLPSGNLGTAVRDLLGSVPEGELTPEVFGRLLAVAGVDGVSLPERMADINEVLNALPRTLSRELLIEFINELYVVAP